MLLFSIRTRSKYDVINSLMAEDAGREKFPVRVVLLYENSCSNKDTFSPVYISEFAQISVQSKTDFNLYV